MSFFGRCCGKLGGGGAETPQCLILGLSQAGKTTLLYRLKLGNAWRKEDMARSLKELREVKDGKTGDPSYHYEELTMGSKTYGIWEVPGTPAMRHCWQAFYSCIKIHCVIFVVDGAETNPDKIATSKKLIHLLMNEDELRQACFAIIVNNRKVNGRLAYDFKIEDQLEYKLGLHELHESCAWRCQKFVINIMDINQANDHNWAPVRDWIKEKIEMAQEKAAASA